MIKNLVNDDQQVLNDFIKANLPQGESLFTEENSEMDRNIVPHPIYDENQEFIDLYYTAWQSAWTHIFTCPGAPVQTYMNEGIRIHRIWIWDTCFMVQFCRYAAAHFPGIQSLDNFYRVLHDGESMVLKVHHPDNPPLFAWTEYEYFKHTGDKERIRKVLVEKQYLQQHYFWLEQLRSGTNLPHSSATVAAQWVAGKGFLWSGCPSGMDNTPRGDDDYGSIYWLDLSAQQGLSALYISRLFHEIGDDLQAAEWNARYEEQKKLVNERFWSKEDQMYFDFKTDESGFSKVLTPASVWPMMAEMCDDDQAEALRKVLDDPNKLGGKYPVPSVSRDDPRFSPKGSYWRGGIWMPTLYMSVKALEKYGFTDLADSIARNIISQQFRTWQSVEPHTIWECYSPTADLPSTCREDVYSRPDFCGWSALGPISLFIENLLGIRDVNTLKGTLVWEPRSNQRSGIENLKMGSNTVTLIADPQNGRATVESSEKFTLKLWGREYIVDQGRNEFPLSEPLA